MFVSDFMTPNPVTAREEDLVADAERRLRQHHIHQLPVVDGHGRLVGIITDRDIRSAVGYDEKIGHELQVAEVMHPDPETIGPSATLEEALALLCHRRYGSLPVVQGERVVGIITKNDILKALYHFLGLDRAGTRLEVELRRPTADLATAFAALAEVEQQVISAIVASLPKRPEQSILFIRLAGVDPRRAQRALMNAGLTLLELSATHG